MRSGVWRYHPVRHEFEIFAHGGSNQWGLDFNEQRPSLHDALPQLLGRRRHDARHPQRPLLEPGQLQLRALHLQRRARTSRPI